MMNSAIRRFRKKPIEVEAVQWNGNNYHFIREWTGNKFDALADDDRENCDDPEATAQVFDSLHSTWVLVYDRDWIIRGVKGEFYPCRDEVFQETYERAGL